MVLTDELVQQLQTLYATFPRGRDALWRFANEKGVEVSRREVALFLANYEPHQVKLGKPMHKPTIGPILTTVPFQRVQVDLIHFPDLAPSNYGHTYIMTAIDHFSKYAWAVSIKDAKSETVAIAMNDIVQNAVSIGFRISLVQSDNGKEFQGAFHQYLMTNNIHHIYSTPHSPWVNGVVERFNRTIKSMIYSKIQLDGSKRYTDFLQELVGTYNQGYHRSIHTSPSYFIQSPEMQARVAAENADKRKEYEKTQVGILPEGTTIRIRTTALYRIFPGMYRPLDKHDKRIEIWSREVFHLGKPIIVNRILTSYHLRGMDRTVSINDICVINGSTLITQQQKMARHTIHIQPEAEIEVPESPAPEPREPRPVRTSAFKSRQLMVKLVEKKDV